MRLREFGATGMRVSEIGFGAWAIGGKSYGAVDRRESLRALARAEELGCNFVDTAEVYGDSELVLGDFLRGRRDRWFVATKYSGQAEGLLRTAERQLTRLGVESIDFYQLHWVPRGKDAHLLDDLRALKESGKARFIGVSLYTVVDIDHVLDHGALDGFQVPFSLLDPDPFLARLDRIRAERVGVIVRSSLKSGFLTGKFTGDASFPDPADQRGKMARAEIVRTVERVERFRFLEKEAGSLLAAAARYPLSFPEVSTVILGTKSSAQADANFGAVPGSVLGMESLNAIRSLQKQLRLGSGASSGFRAILARVKARIAEGMGGAR